MRESKSSVYYELEGQDKLSLLKKRSLEFNFTRLDFRSWYDTSIVLKNHRVDFYEVVWVANILYFLAPGQTIQSCDFDHENCLVISFTQNFIESLFKARNPLAELPFPATGTQQLSSFCLNFSQKATVEKLTDKIEGEYLFLGTPCSADIIRSYVQILLAQVIKWVSI